MVRAILEDNQQGRNYFCPVCQLEINDHTDDVTRDCHGFIFIA